MTTAVINVCAASVLIVWATWCGMSRSVNDGVIGKAIYAVIAMASFSVVKQPSDNQAAFTVLVVAFALLGLRHYWLRCGKWALMYSGMKKQPGEKSKWL